MGPHHFRGSLPPPPTPACPTAVERKLGPVTVYNRCDPSRSLSSKGCISPAKCKYGGPRVANGSGRNLLWISVLLGPLRYRSERVRVRQGWSPGLPAVLNSATCLWGVLMAFLMSLESYLADRHRQGQRLQYGSNQVNPLCRRHHELANSLAKLKTLALGLRLGRIKVQFSL